MNRIGIAGVGGIGSNVAMLLARMGVAMFSLVDFDLVDQSNLNRQFYFEHQRGRVKVEMLRDNLLQINPRLDIAVRQERLTRGNMRDAFADCRLLVEGFDEPGAKKELLEVFGDSGKVVISASGISGRCMEKIRVQKLGNAVVVGDLVSDCRRQPLHPPKIMMIAAMMADLAWLQLPKEGETDAG